MNKDLIKPIAERISLGYAKAAIKKEVMANGYPEAEFEEAYQAALSKSSPGRQSPQGSAAAPTRNTGGTEAVESTESHKGHVVSIISLIVFLLLAAGGVVGAVYYMQNTAVSDPLTGNAFESWLSERGGLSESELVDMTAPSVVRIATHFVGTTTVERIDVDFESGDIFLEEGDQEPLEFPFDVKVTGTGFIISDEGHIATNGHVVYPETIYDTIMFDQWLPGEILEQFSDMSEEEIEVALEQVDAIDNGNVTDAEDLEQYQFFLDNSELEYTAEVVVYDPRAGGSTFNEQFDNGIPAEVLALDEQFIVNEEDVAVITIDEEGLAPLAIGDSANVSTSDRVFAFGYPGNTDLSRADRTTLSFTDGSVSAKKQGPYGDFEYIQTNAKISGGSSGGPLLNDRGEVVGVITLRSGGDFGDSFGFAVPTSVISDLPGYDASWINGGSYRTPILEGMYLMEQQHCALAQERFEAARANGVVFNNNEIIDTYMDECDDLIAAGDSIDTKYDELMQELRSSDNIIIIVTAISGFFILILIIVVALLIRQVKKNRQRIGTMGRGK